MSETVILKQVKWGKHEEGYFETGLSLKPSRFKGPSTGDRFVYYSGQELAMFSLSADFLKSYRKESKAYHNIVEVYVMVRNQRIEHQWTMENNYKLLLFDFIRDRYGVPTISYNEILGEGE